MLRAEGLAEGVRLGSNGLLIWSVRFSTWECDWDPNRALKRQTNSAQRIFAYQSDIESEFRTSKPRVRTHKLNENPDGDFEPRTELDQPAGGLPVLNANCASKARL